VVRFRFVTAKEIAMNRYDADRLVARVTRSVPAGQIARRKLIQGSLVAAIVALGSGPDALDGKKKRKGKSKRKNRGRAPRPSDWTGTWDTRLSNGVRGFATFTFNDAFGVYDGTYSNQTGSGRFSCSGPAPGETALYCEYEQTFGPSQTGAFLIDLTDKDHWEGEYQIDGGGGGTWSGVRR
jgi:hypothetical protein